MEKVKINQERLVQVSVMGEVHAPHSRGGQPYGVGHDGVARVLPGTGGITYNIRVGDSALGWAADHVEPGVTVLNPNEEENNSLNILACVGNEAKVASGDAKGKVGVVTGKHGGSEHILVDFPPEALEALVHGDKILIRAWGRGMEIEGFPEVKTLNLSPQLFEAMGLQGDPHTGVLTVPVAAIVPGELMGSGVGASSERGDYDIMTNDREALAEQGLEGLRLGDIVAIKDHDNSFGRNWRKGAMSIGIVVHSDCFGAGHGPGVTTLLTSATGKIVPQLDKGANIAHYLKCGTLREGI